VQKDNSVLRACTHKDVVVNFYVMFSYEYAFAKLLPDSYEHVCLWSYCMQNTWSWWKRARKVYV